MAQGTHFGFLRLDHELQLRIIGELEFDDRCVYSAAATCRHLPSCAGHQWLWLRCPYHKSSRYHLRAMSHDHSCYIPVCNDANSMRPSCLQSPPGLRQPRDAEMERSTKQQNVGLCGAPREERIPHGFTNSG